ncbi:hypothetical protein G6F65_020896 [Rhizopus arrhizus]|nr:hypothetical protein G6F65_020896 [Rhizopus arrhizus]
MLIHDRRLFAPGQARPGLNLPFRTDAGPGNIQRAASPVDDRTRHGGQLQAAPVGDGRLHHRDDDHPDGHGHAGRSLRAQAAIHGRHHCLRRDLAGVRADGRYPGPDRGALSSGAERRDDADLSGGDPVQPVPRRP